MLARRFSIVCLVAALAGAGLAIIIEETNRTPYSWRADAHRACPFGVNRDCLRLLR